ncbi:MULTISPECIES: DUF3467 domain-containing protein [Persicobacter]|uniref:DUF3467 domain-containing protein n=1 Tax=Persicobacter diffluens TaxID=981 RepID=A0AAN4VZR6_9BACT|nr:DUF3467 domain-containing protein [Persicobacter sp. CCB-QB2]GJM62071.1 hypothetical protein PEDI_26230 [Persicobacter diffluens]
MQEQDQNPKNAGKIDIELPEDMAEGVYANLAMIAHSNSEFVLDFIRIMPGVPKAKVKSRVVLTPEHAVRLLQALQDNVAKYESMHGPIGRNGQQDGGPYNFGGPVGEA